jgi:hypothetical protein
MSSFDQMGFFGHFNMVNTLFWSLGYPAALVVIGVLIQKKTEIWVPILFYVSAGFHVFGSFPSLMYSPLFRSLFSSLSFDNFYKMQPAFSVITTLSSFMFLAALFGMAVALRKK